MLHEVNLAEVINGEALIYRRVDLSANTVYAPNIELNKFTPFRN